MLRTVAIVAILALAGPMLAEAQETIPPHQRPGERPHGPHGPPHARYEPRTQFIYRGRVINRIRVAPFVYPRGFAYRRWAAGGVLPPLFLVPAYFFAAWATLGLEQPPPGFQWVRYGPDLLLVNAATGQIVEVAYGVFY